MKKQVVFLTISFFAFLLVNNSCLSAQGTKIDYSAIEKCAEAKAEPGTVAYQMARDECYEKEAKRAMEAREAKRKAREAKNKAAKEGATKPE